MENFRDKILAAAKKYYQELDDSDFSHNFDHVLRVENLAKKIGEDEKADLQIIEAASLLFDVARKSEDEGKITDHAKEGSNIARQILLEIGFPQEKIDSVCHAILVHRKSKNRVAESLEARILQDADYLDALGAIDIARIIGSSFQSKKYRRPIYVDRPFEGDKDENTSAIHYLIYKLHNPKMQPEKFHTRMGRRLAKDRFKFVQEFADRFVREWKGLEGL